MEIIPAPSKAAIVGHPINAALVPFPIVCFTLTLGTDILYWRTGTLMWQNFSDWLLLAGLVMGGLAALAGIWDLLARPVLRRRQMGWIHGVGNIVVLILAFFNNLIHSRDGWIAVVPTGLILSALTVLVLLCTVWIGRAMVYRHGIGVSYNE